MPRKVRALVKDLLQAGFVEIKGGGKGSHRKFAHPGYSKVVTISGGAGDDVKPYQEKQVAVAIEAIDETE